MKYSPATIAKALVALATSTIGAATVAAGGADLAALTPGQWAAALGAGLIAFGGVFVTPNKSTEPAPVPAPPADAAITAIQQTVQNATAASSELDKLKDAAGSILGAVPIVGPLTQAVIDSAKTARL